jgi:tetratricopeptide (TPR) repeat protein
MPLQTAEYYNGDSSNFTDPNPAVYSCDQFYPQSYAEIISQGYLDGANHIVSIRLNPIRYNPVTQIVEFVNNLYISFSLTTSSSQPIYPEKRFAIDAPKYEAYLSNLVENTDDITNYRNVPDIEIDPNGPDDFSYLIICPDDFELGENSPFASFIQWKEQKGHSVRLMTYSQIANHSDAGNGDDIGTSLINDMPGKVRKYLKHHWQNHGLANVLLVGGMNDLEVIRYAHDMHYFVGDTVPIVNMYPSDVYFAEFQGSWNNDGDVFYGEFGNPSTGELGQPDAVQFFQELFIGRVILPPSSNFPADSPTRQQAVLNWVDKVITYEKGPGSGFDGYLDKCYSLSASGINSGASSVLVTHGFDRLPVNDSFIDGDLRPMGNDVIAGINSYLPGIIILSSHGNKGRMLVADTGIEDTNGNLITSLNRYNIQGFYGDESSNGLDNLFNPLKKFPISLANSCNTGQYDYNRNGESDIPSMAEAFTSYTVAIGGPLWIGNTRPSYSGFFETVFVSNLFNDNVLAGYPNANPWCGGVSFASARFTDGGGTLGQMHARTYFGDPDMEIWTAQPLKLTMSLDYPGRSVVVKDELGAYVENARVVFINDLEKRIVYTDNNGQASTDIDFLWVFAHKQNYVHDAVRIIHNQETIASVGDQTLEISDRIYIPVNSSLVLSGSLRLIHRASIVSDGDLAISSNTIIQGSISSLSADNGMGNKITVNGSISIGDNVHFSATGQMGWDGLSIDNGDAVIMQNLTFTKSPLEVINSSTLMQGCSLANTSLIVIDGMIEMDNSVMSQSTLSIANSSACFDSCEFEESNTLFENSEAEYQNSALTRSQTTSSNSGIIIIEGNYSDSSVDVTGGQLTIQSTDMSSTFDNYPNNDAFVNTVDASVSISDTCEFTRCRIQCNNHGVPNAVNINNSTIQNCATSGISLSNVANFDISSNVITHNQIGIALLYSGTGSQNAFKHNVIENNSSTGVRIVASKVSITGDNEIQQNNIGVTANNFSSWYMLGRESSPTGEYQLVQFNQGHQVFMTYDSAPDYLAFNCIQNSNHNTPWVRVFYPSLSQQINVSNNYWGENFIPALDLNPLSAFIYEHTWTPGNIQAIEESAAAALFRDAFYHESNAEYAAAIADYKQVIELFPTTEYAALAAKALLRIEDVKKDLADPNLDYTALKTYYESESNLYLNQEIDYITSNLIAQTDLRIENYIDAISFYESVISNPPSSVDSLYAIINLGYAYLLMEDSQKGLSYVGKYANLKPISYSAWSANTELILNEIDQLYTSNEQIVSNDVIMTSNYPNPFNPSTTITFSIPETSRVRISVYNIKGQKVKELMNTEMTRGNHRLVWNGKDANNSNVASGIYFIKLESGGKTSIRKAMLMK